MPQVTVTFDCSALTFNVNPNQVVVPANTNAIITWKVVGTHKGPGVSVQFPASGGIVFKPTSNWPGASPVIDPTDSSTYSVADSNTATTVGDYFYTTTVALNNNGVTTSYSYDPDVDNPGTATKLTRTSA